MATDTAKAKKQMRQSNQIEARPVPVYCLSDVRRADIHWERVLGYVGPDDKLPEKNSVGNASYFLRLKTL